jgi:hypothetical protein
MISASHYAVFGIIHAANHQLSCMRIGEAHCASHTRPPIEYHIRSATQRALPSGEDPSDDATTPVQYICPSGSRSAAIIQRSSNGTPTRAVRQRTVLLYSTWHDGYRQAYATAVHETYESTAAQVHGNSGPEAISFPPPVSAPARASS